MFKKIKLGLTLVKYGFRPGINLEMCILFLAIGVVLEISSKGTNIIGAFYFLLTGVYIYHMIESMSISYTPCTRLPCIIPNKRACTKLITQNLTPVR